MRVISHIMDCLHLDPGYALLSVQNCVTVLETFRMMDIHSNGSLNDVQFREFLASLTDLSGEQTDILFELTDIDQSGEMEFEEFYLVYCILIACKDQYEKEFIYRHSGSIFRLIDADDSGLVSNEEFSQMGILFNFDYNSIKNIFNEFDVSGDKNLDFREFRLFTMACIDEQRSADAVIKVASLVGFHERLLYSMEDIIRIFFITNKLPTPKDTDRALRKLPPPYLPPPKRRFKFMDFNYFKSNLRTRKSKWVAKCKDNRCLRIMVKILCCWFVFFKLWKFISRKVGKYFKSRRINKIRTRRGRKKLKRDREKYFRYANRKRKKRRKFVSTRIEDGGIFTRAPEKTVQKKDLAQFRRKGTVAGMTAKRRRFQFFNN